MSKSVDEPKFTTHSMKMSDLFRRFADVLDDPERTVIAQKEDAELAELMSIVSQLKAYSWIKCGGVNLFYPEQSCPVADYKAGAQYDSRKL